MIYSISTQTIRTWLNVKCPMCDKNHAPILQPPLPISLPVFMLVLFSEQIDCYEKWLPITLWAILLQYKQFSETASIFTIGRLTRAPTRVYICAQRCALLSTWGDGTHRCLGTKTERHEHAHSSCSFLCLTCSPLTKTLHMLVMSPQTGGVSKEPAAESLIANPLRQPPMTSPRCTIHQSLTRPFMIALAVYIKYVTLTHAAVMNEVTETQLRATISAAVWQLRYHQIRNHDRQGMKLTTNKKKQVVCHWENGNNATIKQYSILFHITMWACLLMCAGLKHVGGWGLV